MKDSRIIKKNTYVAHRQARLAAKVSEVKDEAASVKWHGHVRVDKYSIAQLNWLAQKLEMPTAVIEAKGGDFLRHHLGGPEEVTEKDGNLLTYTGLAYILCTLTGVTTTTTAGQLGNGYLPVAVGDSTTAATTTDFDLNAATNKWYNPVDPSYPTVGTATSSGVMTVQSTFTTAVGNFAWNEWALFGCSTLFSVGQSTVPGTAQMLNHKAPAALGTKTSSNTWVLVATVTFS